MRIFALSATVCALFGLWAQSSTVSKSVVPISVCGAMLKPGVRWIQTSVGRIGFFVSATGIQLYLHDPASSFVTSIDPQTERGRKAIHSITILGNERSEDQGVVLEGGRVYYPTSTYGDLKEGAKLLAPLGIRLVGTSSTGAEWLVPPPSDMNSDTLRFLPHHLGEIDSLEYARFLAADIFPVSMTSIFFVHDIFDHLYGYVAFSRSSLWPRFRRNLIRLLVVIDNPLLSQHHKSARALIDVLLRKIDLFTDDVSKNFLTPWKTYPHFEWLIHLASGDEEIQKIRDARDKLSSKINRHHGLRAHRDDEPLQFTSISDDEKIMIFNEYVALAVHQLTVFEREQIDTFFDGITL